MTKIIRHFKTTQVARMVGFTVRQLDYWAKTKLLIPSVCQPNGPGSRKLYSFDDLVRLHFIQQLYESGWSVQKIRRAMEQLNEFMRERPEYRNFRLIPDKNTILVVCETEEKQQILLDVLKPGGQQVLWIVLDILREEVEQKTAQLENLAVSTVGLLEEAM